ncbi:3492_t:CDS:2 [Entrophospora sp. SA101]|nr:3492_t:CDS:2 [Entrophospora sp. SA101]
MNNHKKISTQASNHDEQFATESRVFQELREIKSEIKEVKKFLIANSLRQLAEKDQAREKEVAEWDEIQAQDEAQINNGSKVGTKYYVIADLDLRNFAKPLWKHLEKNFLLMKRRQGIKHIKTKRGYHDVFLLDELPPNGAIYHTDKFGVRRKIGDILAVGRQAQALEIECGEKKTEQKLVRNINNESQKSNKNIYKFLKLENIRITSKQATKKVDHYRVNYCDKYQNKGFFFLDSYFRDKKELIQPNLVGSFLLMKERIAELEAITNRTAKQEAELTSKKQELAELEKQQTQDHKKTNRTPWLIGGGIVLKNKMTEFKNLSDLTTTLSSEQDFISCFEKLPDEELAKRQRKEEKRRIELARGYLTEIGNYHIFRKVIEEAEEKGTLESY